MAEPVTKDTNVTNANAPKKNLSRKDIITYMSRKLFTYAHDGEILVAPHIATGGYTYLGPGLHRLNPLKRYAVHKTIDFSFDLTFPSPLRTKKPTTNAQTNTVVPANAYQNEGTDVKVGDVTVKFSVGASVIAKEYQKRTIVDPVTNISSEEKIPVDVPKYLPTMAMAEKAYYEILKANNPRRRGETLEEYEKSIRESCQGIIGKYKIRQQYKEMIADYLAEYGDQSIGAFYRQAEALEETKKDMRQIVNLIVSNSTMEQLRSYPMFSNGKLPDYLDSRVKKYISDKLDYIREKYGMNIVSFGTEDIDLPDKIRQAQEEQAAKDIQNETDLKAANTRQQVATIDAETQRLLQAVPYTVITDVINAVGLNASPEYAAQVLAAALLRDSSVTTYVAGGAGSINSSQFVPMFSALLPILQQQKGMGAQQGQQPDPQQQGPQQGQGMGRH